MQCPACRSESSKVVDTRTARGGRAVRRRRECLDCNDRFTTYEYVEERPLQVLKRSGSAEDFRRDKLRAGVAKACAKRPVSPKEIETLVDEIEDAVSRFAGVQIASANLGELVMSRLKPLDRVAYIRYASVYRNFQDVAEFEQAVGELRLRERRDRLSAGQAELPLGPGCAQ